MNETIKRFGHPKTLLREYEYWVVMVRLEQVTPGSLIIACKENALSLGAVSQEAWSEFKLVSEESELAIHKAFNPDKLNYLALMMKDKHVHFHLIPRYSTKKEFINITWVDADWPAKTELVPQAKLTQKQIDEFKKALSKERSISIKKAKLYTDGGARGNPGPAAIAYVICDMDDNVVEKSGRYIGETTNNQAEYQALEAGLTTVLAKAATEVEVFMDSELVIKQVKGEYRVKNNELQPWHQKVLDLAGQFKTIKFVHVPRALNHKADAEVNRILDEQ